MVTAVDTSVLLDVLLNDPRHCGISIAALRLAANEGSLVICETALAEIVPTLAPPDVPQFLSDWNLTFAPSSQPNALLAGEMFRAYCAISLFLIPVASDPATEMLLSPLAACGHPRPSVISCHELSDR
jgi:hypothetical protein